MGELRPHIVISAVAAAMGGLLFGFDTAVISGVTHSLTSIYRFSPALLGFTASSALVHHLLHLPEIQPGMENSHPPRIYTRSLTAPGWAK
jgi:ABC-type multidrug transport system permease subunit